MAGKEIKELVINVKYKGIKPATDKLNDLSEALNDASDYAALLNEELAAIKVPTALQSLTNQLEKMNTVLSSIDDNTRETGETMEAVLGQLGVNADAAREDISALSDRMEDLGDTTRATGKDIEAGLAKGEKAATGLSGAVKKTNNRLKDTNRQGTNAKRNFSDMAASAGGLASAYALVAANVFALSEAFRLLNEAASVQRLEDVSNVISGQIGVSIKGVAQDLQEATGYAISYQDALRQAAATTAYGFDAQTIEEFALVAKRASIVLGVDMMDALNRVTRGVSKQEIELLDELGITIRLTEAFNEYANQLNISADALNSFQRQQALANAVIKRSEQNLGFADEALKSTSWEQFGATVSSVTNQMLKDFASWEPIIATLEHLNELLKGTQDLPTVSPATEALREVRTDEAAILAMQSLMEERRELLEKEDQLVKDLAKAEAEYSEMYGALADAGYTNGSGSEGIKNLKAELESVQKQLVNSNKEAERMSTYFNLSSLEVQNLSGDLNNLSLLSRSIGSEIDKFTSQIRGDSNPYAALSAQADEALASATKLVDAGRLTTDQARERLKLTEQQFAVLSKIGAFSENYENQLAVQSRLYAITAMQLTAEDRKVQLAEANLNLISSEHALVSEMNLTAAERVSWKKKEYDATVALLQAEDEQVKANQARQLSLEATTDYQLTSVELAEKELVYAKALKTVLQDTTNIRNQDLVIAQKEEALRKAQVADFQRQMSREADTARHNSRNAGLNSAGQPGGLQAQKQAQIELSLAQKLYAEAQMRGDVEAETLRTMQDQVTAAERQLIVAQEQQARQMQSNALAGSQSIISELSPGLGTLSTSIYEAADAWAIMGDSAATAAQQSAAAAQLTASTLQGIGGVISAASAAATSSIDAEIAAVKMSGASQEEQEAKIKELNKKKIKEQEKYAKTSILINTAAGVALALASAPPPISFVQAGLVAAAGALAYQQASNASASQLAALESTTSEGSGTSLTLGDQNSGMTVNTADAATSAERAQSLGDRGIYGRASKGNMHAGNAYIAGENGKELIIPDTNAAVTDVPASTGKQSPLVLQITALDSQSIEDRAPEILKKLEEAANQEGRTIYNQA